MCCSVHKQEGAGVDTHSPECHYWHLSGLLPCPRQAAKTGCSLQSSHPQSARPSAAGQARPSGSSCAGAEILSSLRCYQVQLRDATEGTESEPSLSQGCFPGSGAGVHTAGCCFCLWLHTRNLCWIYRVRKEGGPHATPSANGLQHALRTAVTLHMPFTLHCCPSSSAFSQHFQGPGHRQSLVGAAPSACHLQGHLPSALLWQRCRLPMTPSVETCWEGLRQLRALLKQTLDYDGGCRSRPNRACHALSTLVNHAFLPPTPPITFLMGALKTQEASSGRL